MNNRELDAEVAEKVMGLGPYPPLRACYSSDIAAAMEVVEKMCKRLAVDIESQNSPKEWVVKFWEHGDIQGESRRETLPEAICRAALDAIANVQDGATALRSAPTQ